MNNSSQNSGQYSLNCSIRLKLAEHDIRLAKVPAKMTAKNETWQLRIKPCKTKTIISTMAANVLQQGIQSNSLHLLVQSIQVP